MTLAESTSFIVSYYFDQQVGTGDMDYHVVEHVRNVEAQEPRDEDHRLTFELFVRLAKEATVRRNSPWL